MKVYSSKPGNAGLFIEYSEADGDSDTDRQLGRYSPQPEALFWVRRTPSLTPSVLGPCCVWAVSPRAQNGLLTQLYFRTTCGAGALASATLI